MKLVRMKETIRDLVKGDVFELDDDEADQLIRDEKGELVPHEEEIIEDESMVNEKQNKAMHNKDYENK